MRYSLYLPETNFIERELVERVNRLPRSFDLQQALRDALKRILEEQGL